MTNSSPKITVVIPTYNRSSFLKTAITSVLAQDHQNFTILISDNASTDNTKEIVSEFNDKRIIYYRHEQNIGMQQNWIFCLTNVDSGYIAFLEDDNHFLPNHLSEAIKCLNNNKIGFYFCNSKFDKSLYTTAFEKVIERQPEDVDLCELLIDVNIPASGVVFDASFVKEIDFSIASDLWCMDRFFWRSVIVKSGFIFNPASNIVYVIHDNNITYSLLKNKKAIAKASLQNRLVDAYTILQIITINSEKGKELIQSLQKRSPDSYKHILPCFFGLYKNLDFKKLGIKILKTYLSDKYHKRIHFFKKQYNRIIIQNTNLANTWISGHSIKNKGAINRFDADTVY